MTRDDIIRMAREAGIRQAAALRVWGRDGLTDTEQSDFEAVIRFAALVAAAEREECAKVCDDLELPEHHEGTWAAGWSDGTDDCAAAIRARGYET